MGYFNCVCGVYSWGLGDWYMDMARTYPDGPRWGHLCEFERGLVSNGCGGKGGIINPPDFNFEASCDQHDFNYWLGGDDSDRAKADGQFLDAMLRDAKLLSWWRRPIHIGLAYSYWAAVRLSGGRFFNYGPKKSWKDIEDLVRKVYTSQGRAMTLPVNIYPPAPEGQ